MKSRPALREIIKQSMSRRASLTAKFADKQYRDGYIAAHTRRFLAMQLRAMRGEQSQAEFAEALGKKKTQIARLENPSSSAWTLRTLLEIARKRDVAVVVRFVDADTFIDLTNDLSDDAVECRAVKTSREQAEICAFAEGSRVPKGYTRLYGCVYCHNLQFTVNDRGQWFGRGTWRGQRWQSLAAAAVPRDLVRIDGLARPPRP